MGVHKLVELHHFLGGCAQNSRARFTVEFDSLNHSAYITFSIIILFRKSCHATCLPETYSAQCIHHPDVCYSKSQPNFCPELVGGIKEPIKMPDRNC